MASQIANLKAPQPGVICRAMTASPIENIRNFLNSWQLPFYTSTPKPFATSRDLIAYNEYPIAKSLKRQYNKRSSRVYAPRPSTALQSDRRDHAVFGSWRE